MENMEITKISRLLEVNNDMVHNYYYLVNGRLYNEKRTMYKRFKFVIWFDAFDVQEYFDREFFTKEDIREYAKDYAYNFIDSNYSGYDSFENFIKECNKTIDEYNN